MRKENENIHVFIVKEEYRRSKMMQNANNSLIEKAEPIILNQQNHESVIKELEKMHSDFKGNQEDQTLQTTDHSQQVDPLQISEVPNSTGDLDLLTSLQSLKAEELALIEQKQRLIAREQNLYSELVKKIEKKKLTIANLASEVGDLQSKTKLLGEALSIR